MKKLRFSLLLILFSLPLLSFTPEMKTITLRDGEKITARVCLPDTPINTLVFCIHGTGPNTYLNKRTGFNYYDDLAHGFCKQGVAFFTYNRRGVEVGDTPPLFNKIDSVKYAKYSPRTETEDVETMIAALRKDKRFKQCKIILYGISEGTIIAPMVAERKKTKVDGLLLHGYAHKNMFDIIEWQNSGNTVMTMANPIFDKNNDKAISREEFESKDKLATAYRSYLFQNLGFDFINVVKDSVIDTQDLWKIREPFHKKLLESVATNDNVWIRSNYFNITSQYLKEHFALEPNQTRLLRIDIPIHIFHGTEDENVPVEGVYDLQSRFEACNKKNLTIHVFEKHNHDLNFQNWITDKKYPEGLQTIFDCAGKF